MMMDQRHHYLWIIVIGDRSHVHNFLTRFLNLSYITEDGLHVVADDARDVFIRIMYVLLIVIQTSQNLVSRR
jgi:hypothetical protein